MSKRTKTVQWCEGRILEELSERQQIPTDILRNAEEQQNFDIALQLLLSKKQITKSKDDDGHTIYKLVA